MTVMAASWFALSNHCAFAAVPHDPGKPQMNCHGAAPVKHAPAKDKGSGVECCKVLRATLLPRQKSFASTDQFLLARLSDLAATVVLPHVWDEPVGIEGDTGPPGALSFSELVLQQSVLAHAPPVSLS